MPIAAGKTFWQLTGFSNNDIEADDMDFISIPAGVLDMGSDTLEVRNCVDYWSSRLISTSFSKDIFEAWISKEFPRHRVEIKSFSIGKFPVTNDDYHDFIRTNGISQPPSIIEPGDHPVWGVTFEEAMCYASWLGSRLNTICRLPHESEWEYVARGPSRTEYPFGNQFDPSRCNTCEAKIGRTTPVRAFPGGVSGFGVWDLAGNVEEWTMDSYEPYPGGHFIHDDLTRHLGIHYRITRGGSFLRGGDLARCARRHGAFPDAKLGYVGFRIVIEH